MTLSHCRKVPANETCPWDSPSHTQTTTPPSSSSTTATTATTIATTTTIAPAPAKDSSGGGAGGGGAAPSDSEPTGSGSLTQAIQPRGDREYQSLPAAQLFSCQFLLDYYQTSDIPCCSSLHSASLPDQHSLLRLRHRGPLQPGRPRAGGAPPRD